MNNHKILLQNLLETYLTTEISTPIIRILSCVATVFNNDDVEQSFQFDEALKHAIEDLEWFKTNVYCTETEKEYISELISIFTTWGDFNKSYD